MGNYREQSSGSLTSLTLCPTCYDAIQVWKSSSQQTVCCESSSGPDFTQVTVYVEEGETFFTATMFYTDISLTNPVSDSYYMSMGAVRQKSGTTLSSHTLCPTCSTSISGIKRSLISSNDVCCNVSSTGTYYVDYGESLDTADFIYSDSALTNKLSGFFSEVGSSTYRRFYDTGQAAWTPIACYACFETLTNIRFSPTDAEDVCCDVSSTGTYYVPQGETFATATVLYTTTDFTVIAPAGYYSDD